MKNKIRYIRSIGVLLAIVMASCQPTDDGSHAHDAQGGHIVEAGEMPIIKATVWTDKTELFVEFPALVVGYTSRFAAHFTILDKHQPVSEGTVVVSLFKGEKGIRHTVEAPSSPGIFGPSLQPKEAGIYQLVFEIVTPSIKDKIVLQGIQVFASIEAAQRVLGEAEDNGGISFLKEQAWNIEFQTAPVVTGEIYQVVSTSGVWKVSPSDYKTLVATTNGTVNYTSKNLTEGAIVKKGQVLMTVSSDGLSSNNLSVMIKKAKADFEEAKSDYERKKQLYASNVVPKADFEKVERNYIVAKANYETLKSGYSSEGKQVTAPFSGYVKSISVGNGIFAEQGAPLITITSHQSTLLETQVSSSYSSQLNKIHDIWYQPKPGYWSNLKMAGGYILSVGREVDRAKPLLSVTAQVNEVVEMPVGSFTEVQLAFGEPLVASLVPDSALIEDYGNYSVIVQLSGETFERREVIIGRRNGNDVEVVSGLLVGEVVVTKGAYQVKMASMSGVAPAHGHEH